MSLLFEGWCSGLGRVLWLSSPHGGQGWQQPRGMFPVPEFSSGGCRIRVPERVGDLAIVSPPLGRG